MQHTGPVFGVPAFLIAAVTTWAAGQAYTYEPIDYPGAQDTFVYGMNDRGQFVGGHSSPASGFKGFLFDGQSFTNLDFAFWSPAHAINNNGVICGLLYPWGDGWGSFIYNDGQMNPMDSFSNNLENHAEGINDAGTIAGWYIPRPNAGFFAYSTATGVLVPPVLGIGESYVRAYDINNSGTVVGDLMQMGSHPVPRQAFIFDAVSGHYTYFQLPAAITTAYGISDAGLVVGTFAAATAGGSFVVRPPYGAADWFAIGVPGAAVTTARDINNSGEIAGYYTDAAGRVHGFVARPVRCPADLTGEGDVNTNDFFEFLSLYQAQDMRADFSPGGGINTNDFFAFLAAYQQGLIDC